ncbi:MAG: head-tail connector protein [Clostridia bacterium]|nr:head-tail connector protein [Clostridia bacterium]
MKESDLLEKVKANLILSSAEDDGLLLSYIAAAVSYAEKYQHVGDGYYRMAPMSRTTEQGVVMLASHLYESRDGSTGGFFSDSVDAGKASWDTINLLLRLDREWRV